MSIDRLAQFFQTSDFKWKFKDGYRVPTLDELDEAVMKAMDHLDGEPDLTQIEFGRLIVQKHSQGYDVYVHIAEFPND